MPAHPVPRRGLPALVLLGALALLGEAHGSPAPAAQRPEKGSNVAEKADHLPASPAKPMFTKQSIYLPCYAFVPYGSGVDNWTVYPRGCYANGRNETVSLVAPVHIPLTAGRARISKFRCYANVGKMGSGENVEFLAHLKSNKGGTLAGINRDLRSKAGGEIVGTITKGFDTFDPAERYYDVLVSWKVVLDPDVGWRPDANLFRGCRIDYLVENVP